MNAVQLSVVCQRVREQASLRLDDELSQFEERMVSSHLSCCPDCRTFEASLREVTEALRAAPLESPRQPILVRRTRRVSISAAQIAAAMLAVAALGVVSQGGMPGSQDSTVGEGLSTTNLFTTSWPPEREIAQIDATLLLNTPGPLPAI